MTLPILLLSLVGLFLSLWIVIPAPTAFLLPLGVGAPEISPWLIGINAIALLLVSLSWTGSRLHLLILIGSLLGLGLSLLPLAQFPAANRQIDAEMRSVLGDDFLANVPATTLQSLRSRPLVLADSLRGIALEEVHTDRGIVFARPDEIPLTLNVYRPLNPGRYPTIVTIYGGAWQRGSPDNKTNFNRYLAAQGYTVIAIDYRHAPQYRFPAQLVDVRTALTYIQTHAEELSVDLNHLAMLGRSAGAQLATIAAYASAIPVQAVVNYYGPVDLVAGYRDPPVPDPIETRAVLRAFLGGPPEAAPELYRQASPINYVTTDLPPTLLVYAGRDHVVQAQYGRQLYEQLQATANQAVWLKIPWAEHAFDTVFNGLSNQLALYYTERFLAWALQSTD
ncbi:alpha/beta hydrolase [Halomicronema sp. CCY15110]|uniref:alpha/beta hydrolase n=1 Tax=Halomicronema sp. CCY15110 TaxID=2767773 RepID=UPI001EF1E234|nr:alpha/beta hydrolase [Halomicronema sp. CCY15110]